MPKVSIIVPIYNVEKYIKRCVESLLSQTLEDIQIILVNDGTKDSSGEIAQEYQKQHPEKILYVKKENGGLSDARNYGIPYATGEYIAFLDSDDYVEKDMYELMYEKAIAEKSDMVECDFYWEYPNKKKEDMGRYYQGKKEMLLYARVVAWNKLIKRDLFIKTGIQFPKGLQYEDVAFFYQLIPFIEKVSFVKKPCVHYIQRENSLSNRQNEKTAQIFEVFDIVIQFYKQKGMYQEYKQELEYTYTRLLLCSSLKRMCKIPKKEIRKKLLKETWEKLEENFPKWKENLILQSEKGGKNFYMKQMNRITYPIICQILQWIP